MATSRLSTRRVDWRVQVGTNNKAAQGLIIFEASVSYIPDPLAAGGPRTAIPEPVAAVLDSGGYACTPDPTNPARAGERGVNLFTTDSLGEDGGHWTWTARPQLRSVNGIQMANAVPAFSFAVPTGDGNLDLATVQKVPASPGIGEAQAVALLSQYKSDVDSVVARANAGEFNGQRGLPGVNAVPAQEAVAEYISTPGTPVRDNLDLVVGERIALGLQSKITGVGFNRIIASMNVDEPISDGELLAVVPSPTFFTDFSEYAIGMKPTDWSTQWVDSTWSVVADAGDPSNKVLRQVAESGNSRRAIKWDSVADAENAEIVFRWRSDYVHGNPRAVLQGSGSPGIERGRYGGQNHTIPGSAIGSYVGGVAGNTTNAPAFVFSANTYYITRFRTYNGLTCIKTWLASSPEPAEWSAKTTNSIIQGVGWIGLLAFGAGTKDFDWVGIALNGGRAPMKGQL